MKKLKKGFTLIELVIVIAIIGILAAVLIPGYNYFIEKSRTSNDTSLVRNLNTMMIAAKTDNDYDQFVASADNMRYFLSLNGIDEISTSNKKNLIVFNTTTEQFELITQDDLTSSGITFNTSINVFKAKSLAVRNKISSFEEIFENYIVVSNKGNELAEALYNLHNLKSSYDINAILDNIKDTTVRDKVEDLLLNSVYITTTEFDGSKDSLIVVKSNNQFTSVEPIASNFDLKAKTNVIFTEACTNLNLDYIQHLGSETTGAGMLVPLKVETIKAATTNLNIDKVVIAGKEELLVNASFGNAAVVSVDDAKSVIAGEKTFNDTSAYLHPTNFEELKEYLTYPNKTIFLNPGVNIEIPVGETLTIPATSKIVLRQSTDTVTGLVYGTASSSQTILDDEDYCKTQLTVNGNLVVNGTLVVGSVISYPKQFHQGHVSGDFTRINLNGKITVNNKGNLNVYGYVKGNGTIEALEGGNILAPFVVVDYIGGNLTTELYKVDQSPFNQYTMPNIQSKMTINYGALLKGNCVLYTARTEAYNSTEQIIVGYGNGNQKGLISLKNSAYCDITYDKEKYLVENIGLTTIEIYGGMETNSMSLVVGSISIGTENVVFPIPYNIHFIFNNGTYDINSRYAFYPGSKLEVASNATLNVNENSELYFLNGVVQNTIVNDDVYPFEALENNATFESYSEFILNGTLNIENNASFGGVIQAKNNNTIINTKITSKLDNVLQLGADAVSDIQRTNLFSQEMNALIYTGGEFKCILPGQNYASSSVSNVNVVNETTINYNSAYGVPATPVVASNTYEISQSWTITNQAELQAELDILIEQINNYTEQDATTLTNIMNLYYDVCSKHSPEKISVTKDEIVDYIVLQNIFAGVTDYCDITNTSFEVGDGQIEDIDGSIKFTITAKATGVFSFDISYGDINTTGAKMAIFIEEDGTYEKYIMYEDTAQFNIESGNSYVIHIKELNLVVGSPQCFYLYFSNFTFTPSN